MVRLLLQKAIATTLEKPLYILDLSNFISSRIGDTTKNIRLIFDKVNRENAVLFLDEFDHIGKMRGNDDKDVGEMRRLVNSIIQMVDNFFRESALNCGKPIISIFWMLHSSDASSLE